MIKLKEFSFNHVTQLASFILVMNLSVTSNQIDEFNLVETNDCWDVQLGNGTIIFIQSFTFGGSFCETSFVLGL